MENEGILDARVKDFSKKVEIIEIILICIASLIVPTFLGQWIKTIFGANSVITANSQIIVGSIVNTALIMAAINLKGWKKIIGIVTLPSVSTILGGYVFGTASTFMTFMIPAIWIGNFALIYMYKLLMLAKNKNYFLAGIIGIAIKVAIIFLSFNILKLCGVFPEKVATQLQYAMGLVQLITATIGMFISYAIYKIETKNNKKEV